TYAGLKKPEERAAVIAWLRTLADSPMPLPGAADIAAEAPPAAATPAPESSSPGPAGTPAPAAPATGKATPEPGAKAPPAAP
ncbi:MAG TPA: cytochrome c family protein, partial [Alphaproteobacteria bacterium]|nr:cytochrome c family protein [Alphaproteobacteria bacterium]